MTKSMEESVAERRDYVNRIRESFYSDESGKVRKTAMGEPGQEEEIRFSSLGLRTIVAILIFAAFVYCDQKQLTFQQYETQDVWKQIEWNPLPVEELENLLPVSLESDTP